MSMLRAKRGDRYYVTSDFHFGGLEVKPKDLEEMIKKAVREYMEEERNNKEHFDPELFEVNDEDNQ